MEAGDRCRIVDSAMRGIGERGKQRCLPAMKSGVSDQSKNWLFSSKWFFACSFTRTEMLEPIEQIGKSRNRARRNQFCASGYKLSGNLISSSDHFCFTIIPGARLDEPLIKTDRFFSK